VEIADSVSVARRARKDREQIEVRMSRPSGKLPAQLRVVKTIAPHSRKVTESAQTNAARGH